MSRSALTGHSLNPALSIENGDQNLSQPRRGIGQRMRGPRPFSGHCADLTDLHIFTSAKPE